jgi:hypothetical protein
VALKKNLSESIIVFNPKSAYRVFCIIEPFGSIDLDGIILLPFLG